MLDGEQVEPTSENPTVGAEPKSSLKRLGADLRIAHQGPMPDETASSKRPDTRRQSYLDAIEQSACKRGGVHTRLLLLYLEDEFETGAGVRRYCVGPGGWYCSVYQPGGVT